MEMGKFQRILWSINGVVILIVFLFMGFFFLKEFLRSNSSYTTYTKPEIIVGQKLEQAKEKGLILQGLEYNNPVSVYGSNNYILPVRIRTYEDPEEAESKVAYLSDEARNVDYYNTVNIIFLNPDFSVNHVLLNKKGFIESFRYPSIANEDYEPVSYDTVAHCITYKIGFEDSNKDGVINEYDNLDLYLSTLEGNQLTQVTKNIEVLNYSFISTNKILITFHKRDNTPEEHKIKYFAIYSINENKLTELTQLHETLKNIETILVK